MSFYSKLVCVAFFSFIALPAQASTLYKTGTEFKDCADCPVMVVLPKQSFVMGSPDDEKGRDKVEGPQRKITIDYALAVGKFEVTFDEWDACLIDGGCSERRPKDEGRGRGKFPVINVDWHDAQDYVKWISEKTGQKYRLLSEAEWEYAARAGARTQYSWGAQASHEHANYGSDECCNGFVAGRDQWIYAGPVGSFPPNAFGLHDVLGNVWEWVDDCWDENPANRPDNGSSHKFDGCQYRIMRGGSWASLPVRIRAAFRQAYISDDTGETGGFRVARSD